jgi:hypothetical protein
MRALSSHEAWLDEVPNHVAAAMAAIAVVSFTEVFATTIPPLASLCFNEHRKGGNKFHPRNAEHITTSF